MTYKSPFKVALKSCVGAIKSAIGFFVENKTAASVVLIIVGVAIIFFALTMIVKVMKRLVLSKMERFINRLMGKGWSGGIVAILVGLVANQFDEGDAEGILALIGVLAFLDCEGGAAENAELREGSFLVLELPLGV